MEDNYSLEWSEAFSLVEKRLTDLGLKDKFGGPILGIEAISPVARLRPDDWEKLWDAAQHQEITPREYVSCAGQLIDNFFSELKREQFRKKLTDEIDRLHKKYSHKPVGQKIAVDSQCGTSSAL